MGQLTTRRGLSGQGRAHLRILLAGILAIVVSSVLAPRAAQAAADPLALCQAAIGKAGRTLVKTHIRAWQACLAAEAAGKTCDAAARDAGIAVADARFLTDIAARCSTDTLFTVAPGGLGFAQSCDLEPDAIDIAGCRALPVGDAASLGSCLRCWKRAEIHTLLAAAHPCAAATLPTAGGLVCGARPGACPGGKPEVACESAIAKGMLALAQARVRAVEGCLNRKRAGKVIGACPDAVALKKIHAAEFKATAAATNCGSLPAWWSECPRDADSTCGPSLSTLEGIGGCAASLSSTIADELVCQQYPGAAAGGIVCPAPPPPTTTSTTTSTTTTTTTTTSTTTSTTTTSTTSTTIPPTTTTTSTTSTTTTTSTTSTTSTTLPTDCGDSVVEGAETCDPPSSACGVAGTCSGTCVCLSGTPTIDSINPPLGNLGSIVTIEGDGFGTDMSTVLVHFAFSAGGEVLDSYVPVLDGSATSLRVALPPLAPFEESSVTVYVSYSASNVVPYEAGGYPWDPTPDAPGSEMRSLLGLLDELARRFDVKLDRWFVDTETLPPDSVAYFHEAATRMRTGIAAFLASLDSYDPDVLRATDALVSTSLFLELRDRVQRGVDALEGSPRGEILCEGEEVVEILGDILTVLDVVSQVIDVIIVAVAAACAAAILLAIFTFGLAGPFAAIICGGAFTVAMEILRTFNEVLGACAAAITAITLAAPTTPVVDTWAVQVRHPAWYGAEPDFVYVDGEPPVQVRSTQSFENAACAPFGGCNVAFTVSVFEIPIPISIIVPYMVVPGQAMDTELAFPTGVGGAGFNEVATAVDGLALFTALDVNGPGRVRGVYDATFSSDCTTEGDLLGMETHSYEVVAGPHVVSISTDHGRLGEMVEVCAEHVPPNGAYLDLDFGDAAAQGSPGATDGCFLFPVPDSVGADPVILLALGIPADSTHPFTIDPPLLQSLTPDAAFPGETIKLRGLGFAAAPANNLLTLDGLPLDVTSSSSTEIEFVVPDAPSGNLQLVAVGVHTSNTIPLQILSWSAPARLSHPGRDATRPALAVNSLGDIGVVWADRGLDGGRWRLLFTSARPGDASFRDPFEISSDLGQFGDAPERPAIAALADDGFFVVWIAADGSIRRMSLAPDGSSSIETEVISAPGDAVWHDLDVAALTAESVVVIGVETQPDDGDYNTELFTLTSTNDGVTFAPPASFAGPAPFAGEIDLATSNGVLVRAYRTVSGFNGPMISTQLSSDGLIWSAPAEGSDAGGDGDVTRRPSVAALPDGALLTWEHHSTFFGENVRVRPEPYSIEGSTFEGSVSGHDSRPSLITDSYAIATLAWVERVDGISPDLVGGVPRVLVARSLDGFESTTRSSAYTPTIVPPDDTTVDSEPTIAVGPDQRAHLVWLRGTPGNRVVHHTTTVDPSWGDAALGNDPAAVPTPAHDWIVVRLNEGWDPFSGHLAIDVTDPTRTRWLATGTNRNFREIMPSLHPDVAALLYMKEAEPALWDFGDSERAIRTHDGAGLVGPVVNVEWTPDARILGTRVHIFLGGGGAVAHVHDKAVLSDAPWPLLTDFDYVYAAGSSIPWGETSPVMNAAGTHVAVTVEVDVAASRKAYSLVVYEASAPFSVVFQYEGGMQAAWAPVEDKLVFAERIDTNPADNDFFDGVVLHEWTLGDPAPAPLLVPPAGVDLAFPRYSNDGTDVVYQRRNTLASRWFVELLSGAVVPAVAGAADTSPLWSPDDSTLLFVRTDSFSSELATWQPGAPAATLLTDLPEGSLLGGAETLGCSANGRVPECFEGRPSWVRITP